jgi:hypothetical protein
MASTNGTGFIIRNIKTGFAKLDVAAQFVQ